MAKKQKIIAQIRDNSVFLIPVFLVLLIAPTIVYMRAVEQSEVAMTFWKGGKVTYDFFCYYKTLALRLCASIGILFILTQKFLYGFKFKFEKKIFIPLLVFLWFGAVSTFLSDYQEFAWLGFPDRFEGYLSILSYAFIMYMVYDLADNVKTHQWFFTIIIFLAFLLSTIGLFQYFNMDFFQTQFGKELILPSEFEYAANKLSFHQKNPVYMTLYQSNFAGSFTAMMFPMSFVALFFLKEKWQGIRFWAFLFLHLLIYSVWVACDSRAGLVGGFVALVVAFYFLRKLLRSNWKMIAGLLVAYVLITVGLKMRPQNILFTRYQQDGDGIERVMVEDLQIDKNKIKLKTNLWEATLVHNGKDLNIFDEKNVALPISTPQPGVMQITDPRYSGRYTGLIVRLIKNQKQELFLQFLIGPSSQLTFQFLPNNQFVLYDLARKKVIELTPIRKLGGDRFNKLASNRGYIWSRGAPLLLNNLLVGNGFDTFAAYFPQHDIPGKSQAWLSTNIIVEKPHNFFLDIGVSAGVPALISFIVFLFFVIKKAFKSISKDLSTSDLQTEAVIVVGILGFLVSCQFNDSIVSVSIIFWILLGLLMNLNQKVVD